MANKITIKQKDAKQQLCNRCCVPQLQARLSHSMNVAAPKSHPPLFKLRSESDPVPKASVSIPLHISALFC